MCSVREHFMLESIIQLYTIKQKKQVNKLTKAVESGEKKKNQAIKSWLPICWRSFPSGAVRSKFQPCGN